MKRLTMLAAATALAAVIATVIAHPVLAAEPDDSLRQLEAAVAADPESLRAASGYRMAVIKAGEYDRCVSFFEKLVAAHPRAANAWLNYGYAYVDKIPAAGSITQVILANNAVTQFSKSIELRESWLALYTRGNSYLYWPKVFGRAPLGVADLEKAVSIARKEEKKKRVYARSFAALGDGYWKTGQLDRAKVIWREGAKLFPDDPQLRARLDALDQGVEALEAYVSEQLDPHKRVDTNLLPLVEED